MEFSQKPLIRKPNNCGSIQFEFQLVVLVCSELKFRVQETACVSVKLLTVSVFCNISLVIKTGFHGA